MSTTTNQRGVIAIDVPTSLRPVIKAASASIVAVGTAPVGCLPGFEWKAGGYASVVNRPILCEIASDFTTQLGESTDWAKYGLCEVYDAMFVEGASSPYIPINVYDPFKHSTAVAPADLPVTDLQVVIDAEVILASLTVAGTGGVTYVDGTDFEFAYNDDSLSGATLNVYPASPMAAETQVMVGYSTPDLTQITDADIIGGVDTNGNYLGLEVLEKVYTVTGVVPATVITPGWGHNHDVMAAANSRVQSISNGRFRAVYLPDVDTAAVRKYEDLFAWMTTANMVSPFEFAGWRRARICGTPRSPPG